MNPIATLQDTPNLELWGNYQAAFDYFNQRLFGGQLPQCILNFTARGKSWGFFRQKTWNRGNAETAIHEISLNPALLTRDDDTIFQQLVRQMVHLWQHTFGQPPGHPGYCNKEWTAKMAALGLPCEKMFGQNVPHTVAPEGLYAAARAEAIQQYFPFKSLYQHKIRTRTRIKFHCPSCGYSVMGTGGGKLICVTQDCHTEMEQEEPEQMSD